MLARLAVGLLSVAAVASCSPASLGSPDASGGTRVVIPAIDLDRSIVRGAQAELDAGLVVHYDDGPGPWADPIEPGAPGTFWLAAHRSSHGATFARIHELKPGDLVYVGQAGARWTYEVSGSRIVDDWVRPSTVYGRNPEARRLVLQCSWPGSRRLLVVAELVSGPGDD